MLSVRAIYRWKSRFATRLEGWDNVRVPADKPHWRVLALWLDVLIFNVLFYLFVKALIFHPLEISSLWQIFLWGLLFTACLYIFNHLHRWRERLRFQATTLQWLFFMAIAFFATFLSNQMTTHKGLDFSWLRPEMIKIVWWLRMFIPLTPYFTVFFILTITFLMWRATTKPKSRLIWLIPLIFSLVMIWLYLDTLAPIEGMSFRPGQYLPPRKGSYIFFAALFGGPPLLLFFLLVIRFYSMAFRVVPIVYFFAQILLNYIGILPMQSIHDLVPILATRGYVTRSIEGVSMFYPPPGTEVDSTFTFLRKMVGTPERLYVNYGPTCGLYAFDRATGKARQQLLPGLMRDLQLAPDGRHLWGTNWYTGDFLSLDADDLKTQCKKDIFPFGLLTPLQFIPYNQEGLFVSNVTPPVISYLAYENIANPCQLSLRKTIDFQKTGYTLFSDGVYGMYLDAPNHRLYALVGMLGDRFLMGLVELDSWTFQIIREVHLRAGMLITPVKGRHTVLIPSYYSDELHEVSLDTMRILRTMHTDPNILGLAHDLRRGLFYAVSRATGMLSVISDGTGEVIRKVPVGNKAEPVWLDEENDLLFIGSRLGIVQIELAKFLHGESLAARPLAEPAPDEETAAEPSPEAAPANEASPDPGA